MLISFSEDILDRNYNDHSQSLSNLSKLFFTFTYMQTKQDSNKKAVTL